MAQISTEEDGFTSTRCMQCKKWIWLLIFLIDSRPTLNRKVWNGSTGNTRGRLSVEWTFHVTCPCWYAYVSCHVSKCYLIIRLIILISPLTPIRDIHSISLIRNLIIWLIVSQVRSDRAPIDHFQNKFRVEHIWMCATTVGCFIRTRASNDHSAINYKHCDCFIPSIILFRFWYT